MIQAGELLAQRYEVQDRLGKGGFAVVYRALDRVFQREVALKVVELDEPESGEVSNLLSEARFIAGKHHPNILDVYDFGQQDDTAYLVMPLAAGGTLSHYIKQQGGRLPLENVQIILQQIAFGMDYAHDLGVIHRDIKPQNILLFTQRPMHLVISDFGLAKVAEQSSLYSSTRVSGTPSYMAPEQIKGKPGRGCDIYALGVMLYQMLAGQLPYQGDPVSVMFAHVNEPVPLLAEVRPDLPPAISNIVAQAMAKDPQARPRRAEDINNVFKAVLGSTDPFATPHTPKAPAPVEEATLALPLSQSPSTYASTAPYPTTTTNTSSASSEDENTAWIDPTAPTPASMTPVSAPVTPASNPTQAQVTPVVAPVANLAKESMAAPVVVEEAAPAKKKRRFEFKLNINIAFSIGAILFFGVLAVAILSLSSNTNQGFSNSGNSGVANVPATSTSSASGPNPTPPIALGGGFPPTPVSATGQAPGQTVGNAGQSPDGATSNDPVVVQASPGSSVAAVDFSPDGKYFVTGSADNVVRLWNTSTRQVAHVLAGHTAPIKAVVFSPDDKKVAASAYDGTVLVWDITTGNLLQTLKAPDTLTNINAIVFTPDSQSLVGAANDPSKVNQAQTVVWDITSSTVLNTIGAPMGIGIWAVAVRPDGNQIAIGYGNGLFQLHSVVGGYNTVRELMGHTKLIRWIQYTADGKTVLTSSDDNTVKGWDSTGTNPTPTEIVPATTLPNTLTAMCLSSDNTIALGSGDGTARLWSSSAPYKQLGPILSVKGNTSAVSSVAFSGDSTKLATGYADGTVRIWNVIAYKAVP